VSSVSGLGVDIVEVAQMRHILEGVAGAPFVAKTFSQDEIRQAEDSVEKLASLFAAKEAAFKAFRTGWIDGQLVETLHEKNGAPTLALHGQMATFAKQQAITELWVSLSTTEHWAAAVVIVGR
jgi:holo-[acyl-carrier protein] synthase